MSNNQSIRDQLIGAWELISYVVYSEQDDSKVLYPLGKDCKGIIMYTPDGYMSAQLQCPGQNAFVATWPVDGTELELAESARRYIGYTGAFYLDESGAIPVLHHRFAVSSFPNWIGDVQKRLVKLEGDQLDLSLDSSVQLKGERWNPMLRWRRLAHNDVNQPPAIS